MSAFARCGYQCSKAVEMRFIEIALERFRILVLLVVWVGSCAPIQNRSVESEQLRNKFIPELLAWGKSDSQQLDLANLQSLRGFDYFCYVWEYQRYTKIEALLGPMQRYSGARAGILVPEGDIAIIAVRGRHAHVAHFNYYKQVSVGRADDKNCVALKHARLVKERSKMGGGIIARLKAASASTS